VSLSKGMIPWVLAVQPWLFAQAPDVLFVGNSPGRERLSPGVRADVQVKGPHDPLPAGFSETLTVQVGGLSAPVLARSTFATIAYLTIQIPVELALGPTTIEVTSGLSGTSSRPFHIRLDPYAPGLTGNVTRLTPSGSSPVSCLPGETAMPGDVVTAKVVGLGPTEPRVPTGTRAPDTPRALTVVRPSITVSGEAAEVVESVLAPGEIGVYAVTFRVPPGTSAGNASVQLSIGGYDSRDANLRVGRHVTHASPVGGRVNLAAPESIMSAYACGLTLANTPATGDVRSPPLALGPITVRIKDSAGTERAAALYYADRFQVNYVVPSGTATGIATATVTSADGSNTTSMMEIFPVVPSLFTVCCWEDGASPDGDFFFPAGHLVRVRDGVRTVEPVFQVNTAGKIVPAPIDIGPDTDELFLEFFGTGLRFRSSLSNVIGAIAGTAVPVEYVGPQGEFPGLDRITLRIPRALAKFFARANVAVGLAVDGWFLRAGSVAF